MLMKKISAILLAGGSGSRFGGERNKVYEDLGGKPVLLWSLDVLLAHPAVSEVVIAVRKGEEEGAAEVLGAAENPAAKPVFSVFGGITRTASVHNALDRTKGEIVLVHDGARPFLRREDIDACIGAMEDVPGAAIAVPLIDTIKRADEEGRVIETIPRDGIWAMKTPQCFRRKEFAEAMLWYGEELGLTDDCMLMERAGYPVRLLCGSSRNIKITTREDLAVAEALLKQ